MSNIIYGRNSVKEAIKANRNILCLFKDKNLKVEKGPILQILTLAKNKNIPIKCLDSKDLDLKAEMGNHQGILAQVEDYKYSSVDEILDLAKKKNEQPFIIIADGIEDPHNLGAIIRTAECAGAHGVIIPKHNCTGVTSTVEKVAVGATEYMKVARVTNLSRTLEDLKKVGIWSYCADMDGKAYYSTDFSGPVALIVGSEGKGVRPLIKRSCDFVVSLPLLGKISSLNASVAAGILMYEVSKTRILNKK